MFYLDIQDDDSLIGKCINKEPPNTRIILGRAGTGKSTQIKERNKKDQSYCLLTAPTGIAAINLDTRTTNSVLGYYNTESLLLRYKTVKLHDRLEWIRRHYKNLVIDEVSMLGAKKSDIIVEAISEINHGKRDKLGLIFIGDFLQLPPVKESHTFEGNSWPLISNNITKLEKIYRQDNPEFIQALSYLRQGKGQHCLSILEKLGVKFTTKLDENFDGTTIMGMNDTIKEYNAKRFNVISKPVIRISPIRRGFQLHEWDEHIPIEMRFKETAYVTIGANDIDNWQFVNGDLGVIIKYEPATNKNKDNDYFIVRLKRTNEEVKIPRITRHNLIPEEPPQKAYTSMFMPRFDIQAQQWIIGTINYHPLKLAYGSTVQKAQGLTLDKVQIDIRAYNFNYPNMLYVALSRAKSHKDLIIVGTKSDFAHKAKIDIRALKWI